MQLGPLTGISTVYKFIDYMMTKLEEPKKKPILKDQQLIFLFCDNCTFKQQLEAYPEEDMHCSSCGCVNNIRIEFINKKFYDLMSRQSWKKRS